MNYARLIGYGLIVLLNLDMMGNVHAADDCVHFSPNISRAIEAFTASIRGAEDCTTRLTGQGDLNNNGVTDQIVVFTVEGSCPDEAEESPGSCGNHYETYLLAFMGRDQVPGTPLQIGGKDIFLPESVTFAKGVIQIDGSKYGKHDPSCCPSEKNRQHYRLEGESFVVATADGQPPAKPAKGMTGHLMVEGTPVSYQPQPEVSPHAVAFEMESKGYRNGYLLDCLERKYLWVKNVDLRTHQETGNHTGAEWKLMSEKSTITNAVYDAVCPQLLGANAAVTPTDCIRTEPYLPAGWCQPGPADITGLWLEYQDKVPEPYHITGWFDENSTKDHAWILYRQDRSAWGIFVFLMGDKSYTPIKFGEIPLDSANGFQEYHLTAAKPGEIVTACGIGFWDCEPDEPAKVILKTNGIIQAPYDKGGTVLWYYQAGKFKDVMLDD